MAFKKKKLVLHQGIMSNIITQNYKGVVKKNILCQIKYKKFVSFKNRPLGFNREQRRVGTL